MYAEIIKSKIVDYCKLKNIEVRGVKIKCLHCPFCNKVGCSATVIPNTSKIRCASCSNGGKTYNLIELVRQFENKPNDSDEVILTYIKNLLNINVTTALDETELDKLLTKYQGYNWALVPCSRPSPIHCANEKIYTGKEAIQANWQNIENRDKAEWFHWVKSGLNIGVRTGEVSGITVLDFDFYTKAEKVELVDTTTSKTRLEELKTRKKMPYMDLGNTLIQETLGGFHLFYKYVDLPKCAITLNGFHVDVENNGGQVVITPSSKVGVEQEYIVVVDGKNLTKKTIAGFGERKWINDLPIAVIPEALLKEIQEQLKKPSTIVPEMKNIDDNLIKEEIDTENFKVKDLTNNRHNTLVKLGGLFQKRMNINQVGNVLDILNYHLLEDPLPATELMTIVESLSKYVDSNEQEMIGILLDYLAETDMATKSEIELAIFGEKATSERKKKLDKILVNLLLSNKIIRYHTHYYKLVKDFTYIEDFTKVGVQIDFKIPYFHDYAYFNRGDLILVQGQPKVGKTTLSMNFCKRLVAQGFNKDQLIYLYNESGGRYGATAMKLGLKVGDFKMARCTNPDEAIILKNKIYIYDWIRVSDFSKTADIYERLVTKLEDANSIMIGFTQLKEKNTQFAPNFINQFLSMSALYIYDDEQGIKTHFKVGFVRDRKYSGKEWHIPCQYSEETREVKMIEELDEERKKQEQVDKEIELSKQNEIILIEKESATL